MSSLSSVKNSMLWAAYGDAIGYITELCNASVLKYRTNGLERVTKLIPWKRKIGGRYGLSMLLPEGCYSDDTQLRLSVCRSIKKDGKFDFETFSKIEVPVFLSYGLGVGKGTKAAGESLQKKSIQWNTNFFETKNSQYTSAGGNGAAMRIQPHVWAASDQVTDGELINEIMRDTIITHGHPIGWVGAVFHGLTLRHSFIKRECPAPDKWIAILDKTRKLVEICQKDRLLKDIWVPTWERRTGKSLESGVAEAIDDMMKDIKKIHLLLQNSTKELQPGEMPSEQKYHSAVKAINALDSTVRGSATKTALLSTYIGYYFSKEPAKGIENCVNTLGSDTDTIATMAGALLGARSEIKPPQSVLDYDYLVSQASRLYDISCGKPVSQFSYPDLLLWNLPKSHLDYTGSYNNRIALCGLGLLNPEGEAIAQKHAKSVYIWRFAKTSFGQTVLLKHRENLEALPLQVMPSKLMIDQYIQPEVADTKRTNMSSARISNKWSDRTQKQDQKSLPFRPKSLDEITDLLIKSGFNEADIGKQLLSYAGEEDGLEKAIAFASIIVKAKRVRLKKKLYSTK